MPRTKMDDESDGEMDKDARIAELERALEDARQPTDGTSLRDRRILGSVQIMGESQWIPVAVLPDRDTERKLFVDKCDDLCLAPKMTRLDPGVEPPPLEPWPHIQPLDERIPRGPSNPVQQPQGDAW